MIKAIKISRMIVVRVAVVLIVVACVIVVKNVKMEMGYKRFMEQYPPGTSAQKVMNDCGGALVPFGDGNVLPYVPTPEQNKNIACYFIKLSEIDAEVQFNADKELVRVRRLSHVAEIDAIGPARTNQKLRDANEE